MEVSEGEWHGNTYRLVGVALLTGMLPNSEIVDILRIAYRTIPFYGPFSFVVIF
jgi:hypothetical protein